MEMGERRRWFGGRRWRDVWERCLLNEGNPCFYRENGSSPNGHNPRSSSHWWRDFRFQRHHFFNLRKSSKGEAQNFQVVRHDPRWGWQRLAFQTWSHSPLRSASVISSNRTIERLGFFISVFLFYLHLCFSVYFAKNDSVYNKLCICKLKNIEFKICVMQPRNT